MATISTLKENKNLELFNDGIIANLINNKLDKNAISRSTSITTEGTNALDAMEKNSTIVGSMAYDIENLKGVDTNLTNRVISLERLIKTNSFNLGNQGTGWYHIAIYDPSLAPYDTIGKRNLASGQSAYGCKISLKRGFNHGGAEYIALEFGADYGASKFKTITAMGGRLMTKIRHTIADTKSYIDIYYASDTINSVKVNIIDAVDAAGIPWAPLEVAEKVDETQDGVTVRTVYTIENV